MQNKKIKIILAAIATLLVLTVGGIFIYSNLKPKEPKTDVLGVQTQKISLSIKNKDSKTQDYSIEFKENETAFSLLTRLKSENKDFTFESKEFEFDGKKSSFVNSFNNIQIDSTKEFWKFSVNNKESQVGVSDYIINKNDNISFEIATF